MNGAAKLVEKLGSVVGAAHVEARDGATWVRPGAGGEIAGLLAAAATAGAAVGVGAAVRGASDDAPRVHLDLGRMSHVLHLDETSLLVTVQTGATAEGLERVLRERALTLGPLPAPSLGRTLGALAAAPRPSEASPALGRFVDRVAGVVALLPDGREVSTRVAPRKAVGPDLAHALLGGRGTTGILTAVTLRVVRRPEVDLAAAFVFSRIEDALAGACALLVAGGRPFDLRVDPGPPTVSLACAGVRVHAEAELALAVAVLADAGGRQTRHVPPPRIAGAPHERLVRLDEIEAALPPAGGCVVGWTRLGAAVIDPSRPAQVPPLHPLFAAFKRRLDPEARLTAWPSG